MCAVMVYELVGPVLTKWALARAGEIAPENLRRPKSSKKALATANDAPIETPVETVTEVPLDNVTQPSETPVEVPITDSTTAEQEDNK